MAFVCSLYLRNEQGLKLEQTSESKTHVKLPNRSLWLKPFGDLWPDSHVLTRFYSHTFHQTHKIIYFIIVFGEFWLNCVYKLLLNQVHVSKTFSVGPQSSVPQPRCEHSKKFVVLEAQSTSSIKIGSEPVYVYDAIEPPLNPSVWQADWAARVDLVAE